MSPGDGSSSKTNGELGRASLKPLLKMREDTLAERRVLDAIVDASAATCLIGRDDECRMKIERGLVSRRHASIECVAGKFFLHDHSTNGTYVTRGRGCATSERVAMSEDVTKAQGAGWRRL